jgi:hypothetical protein
MLFFLASQHGLARAEALHPALSVTLKPVPGIDPREVGAVDIRIAWEDPRAGRPTAEFRMPHVSSNVESIARVIEPMASDARGEVVLGVRDEGEGPAASRVWTPARPAEGALTLSYRAPITNRLATRGAAPPYELRSEGGAFSAAGHVLLALPDTSEPHRLTVRWDLSALPPGAVGVSSLGAGDRTPDEPVAPSRLASSFYMAGSIGLHPRKPVAPGFFSAWQGEPPFNARDLLEWTEELHGRYSLLFADTVLPQYGVFMRRNLVNPGGGVSLDSSFVATFDVGTSAQGLRILMAHEMFHTWSPWIDRPAGLISSWFSEGLAVHYQRALPRRFGMIGAQDFLDDLNFHAARYYTNALGTEANAQVPLRFWEDTRIRTLPYDRGSFYLAIVDDSLRKRSAGHRSLDDLMLEMIRRKKASGSLSNADWEALLARELGDEAVGEFRAMLAGKWMVPASDAFGPCFRRTSRRLRRYELGFEPKVLTEPRRIVRNLVPGSAAARAGLRNDDEILQPVGQDRLQGLQDTDIELKIRRNGTDFTLRYLPRGEEIDAWQWERDPAASAEACAR